MCIDSKETPLRICTLIKTLKKKKSLKKLTPLEPIFTTIWPLKMIIQVAIQIYSSNFHVMKT